jgi:hypothetical protein
MDESKRDWLDSLPGYMELPDDERFIICNGCGAANSKFDFVPDSIYFLSIREACYRHDYAYHIGETEMDRLAADRQFLNNMFTIIEQQSNFIMRPLRRRRALKYYEAVRELGRAAFWANKPDHLRPK